MAPCAARAHIARGLAHHEEGAAHVDAHDLLEVLDRGLEHRAALAEHAGAGDGRVDIAEGAPGRCEGIDDGLLVSGIALDGEGTAADLLDALGGCRRRAGGPVEHRDVRTEIGQRECRLQPDAGAAAGDERGPAADGRGRGASFSLSLR